MAKPSFVEASDYAVLECKHGRFYYGYENPEIDDDGEEEWCFRATISEKTVQPEMQSVEIVVPFSKLGAKDRFNCVECLMIGIGWVLTKYALVLPK